MVLILSFDMGDIYVPIAGRKVLGIGLVGNEYWGIISLNLMVDAFIHELSVKLSSCVIWGMGLLNACILGDPCSRDVVKAGIVLLWGMNGCTEPYICW